MATHARTLSDDDEAAPLIGQRDEEPTFQERLLALTKEPLTPLLKVLLVVCIILLLLTATFIGLFAGAEHKLNTRPARGEPVTSTLTTTQTATVTTTIHSEPTPSACYTKDCIMLTADILAGMDATQDPCENFYECACWSRSCTC